MRSSGYLWLPILAGLSLACTTNQKKITEYQDRIDHLSQRLAESDQELKRLKDEQLFTARGTLKTSALFTFALR